MMTGLDEAGRQAAGRFEELEEARDIAVNGSRAVIRMTKRVMHSVHLGQDEAVTGMDEAMAALLGSVADLPEILHSGVVGDAMAEYAEARLLIAFVHGEPVPSAETLGITPQSWALGLCDSLGELRRVLLTQLMSAETDAARRTFGMMEEVARIIMDFDVPDAIVPLRRKQDVARGIMERTRSDIATAIVTSGYPHRD